MHKGLPHNTLLNYVTTNFSSLAWTSAAKLNLAKDYSAVNRQHWEQSNPKGVPLVYRVALTFSPQITDVVDVGGGGSDAFPEVFKQDSNMIQCVKINTAHNNWVMRNGAVKAHAARESMFRKQGIKRRERGAYSKTIHYSWSSTNAPDTFLAPRDGDESLFTGGNWEYSRLIYSDDPTGAYLRLIGTHATEESNTAFTTISLPQLYLSSRGEVEPDSNIEYDDAPMKFSILRELLNVQSAQGLQDEIVDLARDEQDVPPYDLIESGDWCEPVESARVFLGVTSGIQKTVVIDIPFGLLELWGMNVYLDDGPATDNDSDTNGMTVRCEVLDIYPMGEY